MTTRGPQDVNRGTGIPAALFDALVRAPFEGKPVAVLEGQYSNIDKLRDVFFSEKSSGTRIAMTGQSMALEQQTPGDNIYTSSIEVCASTETVNTQIDTGHRLFDWLACSIAADVTLGGRAINAAVVEADIIERAMSKRVVVEATVEVMYSRGRP